jgi:NitT/TauT family transport system substrate-binding protein
MSMPKRIGLCLLALALMSAAMPSPARAADVVKVAIGQIDAWANQAPTLGMKAGIFQKHGIALETFGTQGAGETLQAVISGSADIGIGIGTAGAMRAFARGAPVRVLAAAYVGVGDQYWYVPANSPIKSLADATEKHTIAYSTNGATSHVIVLGFVRQLGLKAKPTANGGPT